MVRNDTLLKIRDLVKALSFGIGLLGFLAVVRDTGLLYSMLFVSLSVLAVYREYKSLFVLPRWVLNTISLGFIILALMRMTADNMVVPALESLLLLLAIKFLEEKKFRDYMQIYTIAVFLLAGSALLSLDMVFLAYFTGLLFLLTVTIVLLTYYSQDNDMELKAATALKIVMKSLLITLISVPMTIIFFIILPRTNYPLLNFLNRAGAATTGFTDTVRLGDVSGIQQDSTVILRVKMERIGEDMLYWRGIVLDHFDGISWKSSPKGDVQTRINIPGPRVDQTIFLEPYGNKYFFALDKPLIIFYRNAKKYEDLTHFLPEQIDRRIRYNATSVLSDTLPGMLVDKEAYLQVPAKGAEDLGDIHSLVKKLSGEKNEENTVRTVMDFLKRGEFRYSLKNLPVTSTPLHDFMFVHKYGNCEYFASAMTVMLRLAGIPSRMVGGYRGGSYNELGGYYMVPQSDAHVWVEAYISGKGWSRFDPTPGGTGVGISYQKKTAFLKVKLFFDSINYYWNAFVINYDIEKQISLLNRLRFAVKKPAFDVSLNRKDFVKLLVYASVLLSVFLCLFFLVRKKKSYEEKAIEEFLKEIGRYGYEKGKAEGLEEFVSRIEDPQLRQNAYRFVTEFESYYYRDKKLGKEDMRQLRKLIKA